MTDGLEDFIHAFTRESHAPARCVHLGHDVRCADGRHGRPWAVHLCRSTLYLRFPVPRGALVCLARAARGGKACGHVSRGLEGWPRCGLHHAGGDVTAAGGHALYDGRQDGLHHGALHHPRAARCRIARQAHPSGELDRCSIGARGSLLSVHPWRGLFELRRRARPHQRHVLDGAHPLH